MQHRHNCSRPGWAVRGCGMLPALSDRAAISALEPASVLGPCLEVPQNVYRPEKSADSCKVIQATWVPSFGLGV